MSTGDKVNNIKREPKYDYSFTLDRVKDSFSLNNMLMTQGTPPWVVEDMISILPDDVWNPNTKFLDLYCKTGVFLQAIIEEMVARGVDYSGIEFEDADGNIIKIAHGDKYKKQVREYMRLNQIYGLCWSKDSYEFLITALYGGYGFDDNIKFILNSEKEESDDFGNKTKKARFRKCNCSSCVKCERCCGKFDAKTETYKINADTDKYINETVEFNRMIKEFFGNMKFDIVVGNPPYNNDIYLDFVQMGYNLATKYVLMITPAKWQAKGGTKNEAFRENIVPHMSKVVYYPDNRDVFEVSEIAGITYYNIDKHIHDIKKIKNICEHQRLFNNIEDREFNDKKCLNNVGQIIANKMMIYKKFDPHERQLRYQVCINNKVAVGKNMKTWVSTYNDNGSFQCIQLARIIDTKNEINIKTESRTRNASMRTEDSRVIFDSNDIRECENFVSWLYCKLPRFLVSISLCGLTGIAQKAEWWRFVPDPGSFDKIFEDKPLPGYTPNEDGEYTDKDGNVHCSLYVKYKLTPGEINIIESVIKERK